MEAAALTRNQCARCIFKMRGRATCVAFPRGIPAAILMGQFDHTQAHENDGGIRFVPLRRQRPSDYPSAFPLSR